MTSYAGDEECAQLVNSAIKETVSLPEVRDLYEKRGAQPMVTSPQEMRAFLAAEIEKWSGVVRVSGARVD